MRKNDRQKEQDAKPRRLVLSRETIQALDDPVLLGLVKGGWGGATGPNLTIDTNS